jgi:hypothetical protein
MRLFASLDIATAQAIARLYTITRRDGVVKRATSWPRAIYIGGNVWVPDPGLKEFDIAEKNDGTPASSQLQLGVANDGLITPGDLEDRQYEGAQVLVQICDPFHPAAPDFYQFFRVGAVSKPLYGTVTFALQNPHGFPRENLVPKFTVACRFPFGGVMCGMPVMRPDVARSTAYALGDARRFNAGTSPTGYGNVYFEATTGGATAGTAPTFNYTVGATTTDGSVVWTARNAWERACVIGAVIDPHNMRLAASVDPRDVNGFYAPGKIMFITGRDKGRIYQVAAWRQSDLTLATFIPCGLRVVPGDTAFIWPDCDKTPDQCLNKFDNRRRYGGFDKYDGAASASQVFT